MLTPYLSRCLAHVVPEVTTTEVAAIEVTATKVTGEEDKSVVVNEVTATEVTGEEDQYAVNLDEVRTRHMEDPELITMMSYLQDEFLPDDDNHSRKIVLESKNFELVEGVLYHENPAFPGRWCIYCITKETPHLSHGRSPSRKICWSPIWKEGLRSIETLCLVEGYEE